MKIILQAFSFSIWSMTGLAQNAGSQSILPEHDGMKAPLYNAGDTVKPLYNMYGDLLNDDPVYNPKYAWWIPATRVLATNVFNWALDRYVFNYEWARISTTTWKNNLKNGTEWDSDRFGVNFIGHPHTGNYYFNIARSNGYSYWGSFPFALEGSLIWEYFGENTKPSQNE